MKPQVVWLVLLIHIVLLLLFSGGINTLGLGVLLMFPLMVLTGVITYRAGANQQPKRIDPSFMWRG